MSMVRVKYGAYVVLPVVSMVRVLSLAIGGITHVGRTLRWWRGCCRGQVVWPMLPPAVGVWQVLLW